jgi:hypothetical protein
MRAAARIIVLGFLCLSIGHSPAFAAGADDKHDSGLDVGDLWQRLRHRAEADEQSVADPPEARRFFVLAPSIGSKPSTGVTVGLSGNIAFYTDDPAVTRISSLVGGLKVSQKGQLSAGAKLAAFTAGDRWFLSSDTRMSLTSLNTYPLGADALSSDGENIKYDFLRLYDAAFRRIRPGLFIGAGFNVSRHANIRAGTGGSFDESAYLAYTEKNGFPSDAQTSSGTSVGLLYDTRDNPINADRGSMAAATYRTFFDGFLGGTSTWQEFSFDARTYKSLADDGRRKLAFWFLADMVTGGVAPYLDLPTTGGDNYGRMARGYGEGRYRGEQLLYGEIEYRQTVMSNGLLGFVTFLNTTTIGGPSSSTRLFESMALGAGFGLRVLLNKRSRTNLCADYGWGKQGSRGFYLAIQEAF